MKSIFKMELIKLLICQLRYILCGKLAQFLDELDSCESNKLSY